MAQCFRFSFYVLFVCVSARKTGDAPGAPAARHSAVCPVRGKCVRRYACGVMPYARLNARMKLLALQYPSRSAISARLSGPFCRSAAAALRRDQHKVGLAAVRTRDAVEVVAPVPADGVQRKQGPALRRRQQRDHPDQPEITVLMVHKSFASDSKKLIGNYGKLILLPKRIALFPVLHYDEGTLGKEALPHDFMGTIQTHV